MTVSTSALLPCLTSAGESIRVSVVKPGRTPISVVVNEMSKRKTSAQVAFVDNERLLGEEAAALSVRYPDRVYARHVHHLCRALATAVLNALPPSYVLSHFVAYPPP